MTEVIRAGLSQGASKRATSFSHEVNEKVLKSLQIAITKSEPDPNYSTNDSVAPGLIISEIAFFLAPCYNCTGKRMALMPSERMSKEMLCRYHLSTTISSHSFTVFSGCSLSGGKDPATCSNPSGYSFLLCFC